MLTAPIMHEKEPIGVIMALNKQGANEFSKSDQEVSGHMWVFNSKFLVMSARMTEGTDG